MRYNATNIELTTNVAVDRAVLCVICTKRLFIHTGVLLMQMCFKRVSEGVYYEDLCKYTIEHKFQGTDVER